MKLGRAMRRGRPAAPPGGRFSRGNAARSRAGRSRLAELFERSIAFRIALALLVAYAAIFGVSRVENWVEHRHICLPGDTGWQCLGREMLAIVAVENVESFSILAAAVLYLLETRERRQQADYEAWQAIDRAAVAGISTSYARYKAIQDLNRRAVSLAGLHVPGADLQQIRLPGAILRGADLSGSNLNDADLSGADLCGAKLAGAKLAGAQLVEAKLSEATVIGSDLSAAHLYAANLSGTNLSAANLGRVNLEGANLGRANLTGSHLNRADLREANLSRARLHQASLVEVRLVAANLSGADLSGADLSGADLSDVNLSNANLSGATLRATRLNRANLSGVRFDRARSLTFAQVRAARNWEDADYDDTLQGELERYLAEARPEAAAEDG